MTVGVQGSGWGWLGYNKASGALQLATCASPRAARKSAASRPVVLK